MEPSNPILLLVIGSQGKLRSKRLEHLVTNVKHFFFVDPVQIATENRLETVVNEKLSEVICGKKLSNSELGCAIAHKTARLEADFAIASSGTFKWALFVEDDADLGIDLFNTISRELNNMDFKSPAIVNYDYRNTRGSLNFRKINQSETFRAARHLSPGTVCYAVNREGLQVLRRFGDAPIDCVADWPLQFSHLKVYIPNQTQVFEIQGPTSMGQRQQPTHWVKMLFRQLFYLKKISKLYELSIPKIVTFFFVLRVASPNFRRIQTVQSKFDNCRNTLQRLLRG